MSASAWKDLLYDSKTGTIILAFSGLKNLRGQRIHIRPIRGFNPDTSEKKNNKKRKDSIEIKETLHIMFMISLMQIL